MVIIDPRVLETCSTKWGSEHVYLVDNDYVENISLFKTHNGLKYLRKLFCEPERSGNVVAYEAVYKIVNDQMEHISHSSEDIGTAKI